MTAGSAGESAERENFANRKLIRPTLPRVENHGNHASSAMPAQERRERPERHDRPERMERNERPSGPQGKKLTPPEQMQSRTPMVIVLRDGEEVRGIIEWYDRNCIKINREDGEPNLMIYKPAIKYMFKESENQK